MTVCVGKRVSVAWLQAEGTGTLLHPKVNVNLQEPHPPPYINPERTQPASFLRAISPAMRIPTLSSKKGNEL